VKYTQPVLEDTRFAPLQRTNRITFTTTFMNTIKKNAVRPAAKFDQTCAQLAQMAYHLGPNARMPTFASLCGQTRVSKATLDAALGQLEAQGIVMRRQGAGIFVSSHLRRSIALVCDPQFSLEPRLRGFWELIVREARLRVAGSNYDLTFHFSMIETDSAIEGPPLHPALMEDIRAGRVQGVMTVGLPEQAVEWISEQGVAVVVFAGPGPVSVNLDGVDVVNLGVEALVARGCRHLALWSETWREPECSNGAGDPVEARAFCRALAARGLEFHSNWLRPQAHETPGPSSYDLAYIWAREVFRTPRAGWPDGLLITNDILTRDVMPALQKLDIVPNRDIVIASHANTDSPVLRAYEDDLTLIEYNSGAIVQTMFDQLETLLRGDSVAHRHVIIKPKIRARACVKSPQLADRGGLRVPLPGQNRP
jgi:DNA-binding LacI/PurR family transcriptional regulator